MMKLLGRIVVIAAVLAAMAVPSSAQSLTGAIGGRVVDEQGGALPGVSLTLAGATGSTTAVSDAKGFYRFPAVAPGTYSLEASLAGFQSRQETSIGISVGRQLTFDFQLKIAGVAESVEVVDRAPVVDVTSSATQNSVSQDILFNIPLSRFSYNVLNYAPGVNNDSGYGGGNDSGNSLLLDGVDTRSPSGGGSFVYQNYNVIEEVQVQGLGAPAEYGQFTGAIVNTITKSGKNKFESLFDVRYTSGGLSSNNVPASAVALNPTLEVPQRTNKEFDLTAQFSGPIVKDKLFFFAGVQRYKLDYEPPGPRTAANEVTPRFNAKINWNLGSNDSIIGLFQAEDYNRDKRPNSRFAGSFSTTDETSRQEDSKDQLWSLQWRHIFGANTFSEIKYVGWNGYDYLDPTINAPTRCDETGACYGGGGYSTYFDRKRHQVNAAVSHYAEAFGRHDLKFGVEIERSRVRDRLSYVNGLYYYDYYGAPYVAYSYSYDQRADNHRESFFVQDSWKLNSRLTINPGVRYDRNRGIAAATGQKVFETSGFAPRLGFALDLTGNRSAVLKGSYSQYYEGLFETYYYRVVPGFSDTIEYDVTGDTPVEIDRTPGTSAYRVDPNLKHPRVDEWVVGFEKALGRDVRLAITGIHRNSKNFISSVRPSARWEPVTLENPLNGQPLIAYNWVNEDESENDLLITNPQGFQYKDAAGNVLGTADASARYKALMFVLNRPQKNRWQAQISYVLSKNTGTLDPNTVENIGYGGTYETPTRALVNSKGEFQTSRRHEIKVFTAYDVPKLDFQLGAYYRYISGTTYTPYARFSSSEINYSASGREPWLEPLGSRRLAGESILDLRAEKIFPVGDNRVAIYADLINLFNASTADSVQIRSPSIGINGNDVPFGAPDSITPPRQITFGARWSF